ncbi:MAG: sensor histidine kinase [Chitinophagaceae bacterium]|nr:MAG: sensor histidine kinase [Chitinophagaceae bacterium]
MQGCCGRMAAGLCRTFIPIHPLMLRFVPVIGFLLLLIALPACRDEKPRSEKLERARWEPIFRPAYRAIERDRKLESGLSTYDSILQANPTNNLYVRAARYDVQHFYHYFFSGNYNESTRVIDSAIALFDNYEKKQAYPRTYSGYLMIRGELAFRLKKFEDANEYYILAKNTVERFLDTCEQSTYYYNIAMALYRQKSFDESLRNFKDAYAKQNTCMPQSTPVALQQQEIQGNIGLCYVHLKKYDSALYHFRRELEVAESFRDSLGVVSMDIIRGVALGNMAKIFVARNELDSAEILFRQSLQLNNRPGRDLLDAQLVALQLADVMGREKRYDEMWQLLSQTRSALNSLNLPDGEGEWRRLMYVYYDSTGQKLEELAALKSYMAVRDSLDWEQRNLERADITRQLRNHEQELQIGLLRKDNQIARLWLWVAVGSTIMAVGIVALILLNYRRSRRSLAAQQKLNEQINQQKAALERANLEKDRILYVVAHDLRSPIGVTAYVADQLLLEEVAEALGGQLQMIRDASSQALMLTNELLGLQDQQITFRPCALQPLVQGVADMLLFKAKEKDQQLRVQMENDTLVVHAQPERLQRVVSNLVTNAIKFSPPGRTVDLRLRAEGGEAVLEVRDEGIGIPEAKQGEIFDRFTTARRKGTSGEHSFGLGLSIVRDIVEAHKGSLQVSSSEGKGSCFTVRLPLAGTSA